MATIDLAPTADGDHVDWTQNGGSSKWENMSDGNDGQEIYEVTVGHKQSFFVENLPGAAWGGSITSLKTYIRNEYITNGTMEVFGRLNNSDGSMVAVPSTSSYVWRVTDVLPRPGGGTWTVPEVNGDFEIGVRHASLTQSRVTEYYGRVEYVPGAGGYVALIVGVLGPVLGANIMLAQMPDLVQAFNHARTQHQLQLCEAGQIYNDIKGEKQRRYLWLR